LRLAGRRENVSVAARGNLVDQLYRTLDEVSPDEIMPVIQAALAETMGAADVALLLADYAEVSLERFEPERRRGSPGGRSLPIESTMAGACYRRQEVIQEPDEPGGGWTVCAPVTVRAERFGILKVSLATAPVVEAAAIVAQVASALGYVIASARRYTDVFERARRRRDLALAAEIQWELLPVLGYDAPEFRLAGSLEPAYDIGGDNFDYAIDGDRLTVSISDAMGHGLRASLCATLAVTAMRNCRRAGRGLLEQVEVADQALYEQFGGDIFVTSLVLEIDVATGEGRAINAGHPPAWCQAPRSTEILELPPDPPLGMFADSTYQVRPLTLVPEDRLVLITDGILDAGPSRRDPFGVDRFAALVADHRNTTCGPKRLNQRLVSIATQ